MLGRARLAGFHRFLLGLHPLVGDLRGGHLSVRHGVGHRHPIPYGKLLSGFGCPSADGKRQFLFAHFNHQAILRDRLHLSGSGLRFGHRLRGAWLLGDRNSLTLLTVADGRRSTVAVLDAPASGIVWSSSGTAAVTHGSSLSLWSASTVSAGLVAVDTSVGGIAPIWSADGQNLLYATTGGVQLAHITSSHVTTTTVLQAGDVSALSAAPDGHSVVVATSAGIVLIAPDGTHAKLVDHHTPDGGVLAWSMAG